MKIKYQNLYIVFNGLPGCGKSIAQGEVKKILEKSGFKTIKESKENHSLEMKMTNKVFKI